MSTDFEIAPTMWALRAHTSGGPETLQYEEAPTPEPGTADVLVRVHAASFTATELTWPSTWTDRRGLDRTPVIPGHEISGVVVAQGWGAVAPAIGDEVIGLVDWYRDGGAAEYVAVEGHHLGPKPQSVDHETAAAVPLAGLTAWQGLFDHGRLQAGQTVVVHGAGGGVGTYAVQLARNAGARVIATGRAHAADVAVGLGADTFVDLDQLGDGPLGDPATADVVFDTVGGSVLARSWPMLRPGGRLISVAEPPSAPDGAQAADVTALYFVVLPDRAQLTELSRLVDAGELRPVVGARVPLRDGQSAFAGKLAGGSSGKTVLQIR
jgi:NADPH:quinone reductase-like Zn-dependent oxidoreductase